MIRGKRWSAILLAALLGAAMLAGCAKQKTGTAGTVSDYDSQSHFQIGASGEPSRPKDGSEGVSSAESSAEGEFVVSEKKYSYQGEDLMLLHLENQTNRHYDVTVHGVYLDENGKPVKEESQTYKAFPSGWQNYMIFRPKMAFDGFAYTLEVTDYDPSDPIYCYEGEPLSSYTELTYTKELYWFRGFDANTDRDLMFRFQLTNHHPSRSIGIDFHALVLDEQGEIYGMDYEYYDTWPNPSACWSNTNADPAGGESDGTSQICLKTQAKGGDETIPDNVQGKFTVIFAIADVMDHKALMQSIGF